jgi:hypothetical protein
MSNQLAVYENINNIQSAALALHKSGFFSDVKSEAQAIVKVMAGAELGLPPFASMSGIHIVQGKPVLGANVIATLVKNDPRYDYRVKVSTDKECVLTWLEHGKPVGESSFTWAEATNAGLTGKDNWKKYASDMLFARALTRGARRFAPGIFGGAPVYTPEEMGVETDEEGYIQQPAPVITTKQQPKHEQTQREAQILNELGFDDDVVDAEPVQPKPEPKANVERPLDADTLHDMLSRKADTYGNKTATDKQRQFVAALIGNIFEGDQGKRHLTQRFLLGADSTNDAEAGMILAALDWLKPTKDSGGAYLVDPMAAKECISAYHAAAIDQAIADGQQELPLE